MSFPASNSRLRRVLVAAAAPEDRTVLRERLCEAFGETLRIEAAETLAAAARSLEENLPDCLLLGVDPSGAGGLEFLQTMAARHGPFALGVVALARGPAKEVAHQALRGGAHHFLHMQALDAVLLEQAVRNAVETAWLHRELAASRRELGQKKEDLEKHVRELEREVAERKRTERHTEILSQLGQRLGLLSEPFEIMRVALETLGTHLGAKRCFFLEVDASGETVTVHPEWKRPGMPVVARVYRLKDYGSEDYLQRLSRPRLNVCDVLADPLVRDQASLHLRLGSRAFATASFRREGRWAASLGVSTDEPRVWREDELALLENAVARIWPQVEKARGDRLLIESAEQLKLAASAAGLGAWTLDTNTDVVVFSERGAEIFGLDPECRMTWKNMRLLLHEEDREMARQAVETALATRGEYAVEYRVVRPDGRTVWVAANGRGQYDGATGALAGMVGVVQDISQRKHAERATQQLAAIVESSDDAIISKNLQSCILTWNRGAERLFGYTAEEIVGREITLLLPPGGHDEEPFILERIRRGEPIDHYETIRRHKSGRLLDVSLTVSPIRSETGVIVGASKIARDISRRKITEAMLARRTQTLEILNRVSEALVVERELEKIIRIVTDAARDLCGAHFAAFFCSQALAEKKEPCYTLAGISREEFARFLDRHCTALFEPVLRGEGILRIGDLRRDRPQGAGGPDEWDFPLRSYLALPAKSGSGKIIGCLFLGHPEPDAFSEEAAAAVEGLATQTAIAVDNAGLYRAVRASERQLRLVTNNAPVFLLQCDRDYRFTFVNQPYAARHGRMPEELVGRSIAEIAGAEAFQVVKPFADCALAGERAEFELEIPHEDLGARWIHAVLVPETGDGTAVAGFVGVITDITQRKNGEMELQRARDEALAGSRAKDDFLAALSHELRTPLNPVLLLASDAAEDPAFPPEVRGAFETIRRQVTLEARLIDDLLDLTRITRGKLSLDLRAVDVHDVLRDALATARTDLEGKRLQFDLRLAAADTTVSGDAVRLQQVFWNVLMNAVKFTPDGGGIAVRTSVRGDPRRLCVEIQDTGIGLTAGELTRIFEAFSQGEHAASTGLHRFGGLGLGLAISRSLVQMHGGKILAESEGRNRGATFLIELPLMTAQIPAETGHPADARQPSPRLPMSAPLRRLLIIEDHAPTRNTLKNLLTRRHFEVLAAGSAAEARELARMQRPDLVVSDIGLPDADGCVLLAELRRGNPGLPGIALSGYGMDEDLARTRAAGFVEHLTKPVNVGALERAIARIFSRHPPGSSDDSS
jgi:PAS domain S-box-containing protein